MSRRHFLKTAVLAPLALPVPSTASTLVQSDLQAAWLRSQTYMLEIAQAMPAADYGFRPTPEIRSFGEQMLHTAQGINGFAARLHDEQPLPLSTFASDGQTKQEIIDLLTTALKYGQAGLERLSPERFGNSIPWGGRLYTAPTLSLYGVAHVMFDHTTHHRAQSIIYLRLKGITPPPYVD